MSEEEVDGDYEEFNLDLNDSVEEADLEDAEEEEVINNTEIINALSNFVYEEGNNEEDLISYKFKMKGLLEQLMLKLEEDVDYQKNLESQIDEYEKEIIEKDNLIQRLTIQSKDSIETCKIQTEDLADEMMNKIKNERKRRNILEKMILRLQNENAKIQVSLSLLSPIT